MFAAVHCVSLQSTAQAQVELATQLPRASLVVIRSDGARDCPDATVLAERVRTVAGSNVIGVGLSTTPLETWVQVAISRDFGGYSAQISTSGSRHGTRSLQDLGPTCASLADAVAVTIAMFLDPYDSAPPVLPAPAPITPKRLPEPQAQAKSAATPPSRYFLDGALGLSFNLLAHTQPFLGASFGFRPTARWSVALGGVFVLPDRTSNDPHHVDLRLSYGLLQSCGRALGDIDRASLAFCANGQLGSLAGTGRGYQDTSTKHAWWIALAFGPEAAFRFSHSLSWVLAGQALVPLLSQRFDVQESGVRSSAFQSPSVAGLVSLGIRGHL